MLTIRQSRLAVSTAAFVLVALLAAPLASAESVQGSDRLVRDKRVAGHVKSVLIQDGTSSVAVDARVSDFVAPKAPATYRARLFVNLTCADRGSKPTDADHAAHVDKLRFVGSWTRTKVTSTNKQLFAKPLFTACPAGQVIERYMVRFQVVDAAGASVGQAFVAPSTPLL